MEERYLSLSEAADALDISERTAYRWINSGKLRAYKPGRDYRIPESAIREAVEESEVRPKADSRSSLEPSLFNGLEEERRSALDRALAASDEQFDTWLEAAALPEVLELMPRLNKAASAATGDDRAHILRRAIQVVRRFSQLAGPFSEAKTKKSRAPETPFEREERQEAG
jgi:excisionase family DNA binding protein